MVDAKALRKKIAHNDPWRADEMDSAADGLNWAATDTLKSSGNFDADYAALCRLFEVPAHPCLASRKAEETIEDAVANQKLTPSNAAILSTVQVRNFAVDLTTLRIMMEALKRSPDIDTLTFHNAGLTEASVAILAEFLGQTSVQSLGLDYNASPTSLLKTKVEEPAADAVNEIARKVHPSRSFARLVGEDSSDANAYQNNADAVPVQQPRSLPILRVTRCALIVPEGSKLRALSLRGNRLGDFEAAALAEAIEENTVLCSLNLFDNRITDVGGAAFAKMLRLNTVLRGLSLARNQLTSESADAFGLLLAGGYEVSALEQKKRLAVEAKIAAQNKIAQDAMKKKKDAKLETRLPLSTVVVQTGGDGTSKVVAGGTRSLAALNLSENPELGADGALVGLLSRIATARKDAAEAGGAGAGFGAGAGAVVLQELHLRRCRGYAAQEMDGDDTNIDDERGTLIALSFALRPTKVVV